MSGSETSRVYDELLVAAALAGDRRAFDRLAARWHPRLLRTARRLLGDADGAADAAQDAWIGIARGLPGLNDPARFPAWAFGILHRRCTDRVRSIVRDRVWSAEIEPQTLQPARGEDAAALAQAMAGLSAEHRIAAALHFREGLTAVEVAQAVGVPVGTAKTRIFHARRRLKAALSGGHDDDPNR